MSVVPKLFFTFWQGSNFSLLHYYTIVSLYKYNPDVKVIVYTSTSNKEKVVDWNTGEHSVEITNKVPFESIASINTNLSIINVDFTTYGIDNDISVVFKADFIRIAKLYEHGGVWFDFDVLFIKPFPEELFQTPIDVYFFTYLGTIPTGLLLASPKTDILHTLFKYASNQINESYGYQKIGPTLWCNVFHMYKHLLKNSKLLPTELAYPYTCDEIDELLKPTTDYKTKLQNTMCIHWFNGSYKLKNFINQLNVSTLSTVPLKSPLEACLSSIYLQVAI